MNELRERKKEEGLAPSEGGESVAVVVLRVIDEDEGELLERAAGVPIKGAELEEGSGGVADRRSPCPKHRAGGLDQLWEHLNLQDLLIRHSTSVCKTLNLFLHSRVQIIAFVSGIERNRVQETNSQMKT